MRNKYVVKLFAKLGKYAWQPRVSIIVKLGTYAWETCYGKLVKSV
jgi:hypothetical protein